MYQVISNQTFEYILNRSVEIQYGGHFSVGGADMIVMPCLMTDNTTSIVHFQSFDCLTHLNIPLYCLPSITNAPTITRQSVTLSSAAIPPPTPPRNTPKIPTPTIPGHHYTLYTHKKKFTHTHYLTLSPINLNGSHLNVTLTLNVNIQI